MGSHVSQERAESAAKAEVDAKAIAVLKGTVNDLTLEVAGLEERADPEATRTTARARKTVRTRKISWCTGRWRFSKWPART